MKVSFPKRMRSIMRRGRSKADRVSVQLAPDVTKAVSIVEIAQTSSQSDHQNSFKKQHQKDELAGYSRKRFKRVYVFSRSVRQRIRSVLAALVTMTLTFATAAKASAQSKSKPVATGAQKSGSERGGTATAQGRATATVVTQTASVTLNPTTNKLEVDTEVNYQISTDKDGTRSVHLE